MTKTAAKKRGGLTGRNGAGRLAGSQKPITGDSRMAGRERVPVDRSKYSGRIAIRVRELREAKGLTVAQLADKVGVPAVRIYKYESNETVIAPDLYPALAKALGVKESEFFPRFK